MSAPKLKPSESPPAPPRALPPVSVRAAQGDPAKETANARSAAPTFRVISTPSGDRADDPESTPFRHRPEHPRMCDAPANGRKQSFRGMTTSEGLACRALV